MFELLFGSGMYRYTYDLQTGTSHYHRKDDTIESWMSPQRRGNEISIKLNHRWTNKKWQFVFCIRSKAASFLKHFCRLVIESFLSDSVSCFIAFSLATLLHFEIKFSSVNERKVKSGCFLYTAETFLCTSLGLRDETKQKAWSSNEQKKSNKNVI